MVKLEKAPVLKPKDVRDALGKKISSHPFYSGVNSRAWGLTTPTQRTTTPESLHRQIVQEPQAVFSTPVDVYNEDKAHMDGLNMTAEDTFGSSSILIKGEKSVRNWDRDMEIVGRYLGTNASFKELAEAYGLTEKRTQEIVNLSLREMIGKKIGEQTQKPRTLLDIREQMEVPESGISRFTDDVIAGKQLPDLVKIYGQDAFKYARVVNSLKIGIKIKI